jgi:hypothetical protein
MSAMRLPFFCAAGFVLEVGGDALEPADRDRFLLDAAAAAGGLARTIAGAAEHAGKYVRIPIDHVGVAVAARRDQTDVFGNRRVRRTGPLTIHDLVEVIRDRNVGSFHLFLLPAARSANLTQGGTEQRPLRGSASPMFRPPIPGADTSRAG